MITIRDASQEKDRDLDLLRFSNIVQYATNPIEITDRQGKIVYANPAFERASGYSMAELLGKNPSVFSSGKHSKTFWKRIWQVILSGEIWMGEIENRRRNGEPFHTKILISPIIGPEGTIAGFFGIHHDITEKKHLEQQLIHAQKMESIGLLAAGLAHEVGNPLTSISSLVQILQRSATDPFTAERLDLIKKQVGRISRIIGDLVGFARRSSFELQLSNLGEILRQSVEIVRVSRKARDIVFDAGIIPDLPPLPLVPDQVEQVFINLLINAVDAIHERSEEERTAGRPSEPGKISITTSLTEESIIATVADNGAGIPEKDLDKIFQPFFTTKQPGSGTGLGLWVSFGIVRSMRGTITVDRNLPRGVTFTITFPLHPELS
jgi:PAS domain S-box-containing protein